MASKITISKILKQCLCVIFLLSFFLLNGAEKTRADGNQKIELKIEDNLDAFLDWTMPIDTSVSNQLVLPSINNLGYTASIKFELLGAKDDKGPIRYETKNDVTTFNSTYPSMVGEKNIKVSYKVKSPFNRSLLIFELPWYSGEMYNNPQIKITYPDSLELVSTSHKIIGTNPLQLEFDSYKLTDLWPVVVSFIEKKIPAGDIKKQVGPYVIVGQPKYVEKLYEAAKTLTFVDDMFLRVYGIDLPEKIYITTNELDTSAMNYEAGALAVPPNILVFNAKAMARTRNLDLQKTIIHETAHVAIYGKRTLFAGVPYYAPWFDEGLAVFAEYYATDNYLVKDETTLKIEDVLSGYRKFSIAELKKEYEREFDYYFLNDDPRREIIDSYSHAGLVFNNFFDQGGPDSIKILLSLLAGTSPRFDFVSEYSDAILDKMRKTAGATENILFPYKDSPDFEKKISKFVRKTFTSEEEGKVVYQTFKNETKAYFGGDVVIEPPKIEAPAKEEKPEDKKENQIVEKREVKKDSVTKPSVPQTTDSNDKKTETASSSTKENIRRFDASKEIENDKQDQETTPMKSGFLQKIIDFFFSLF